MEPNINIQPIQTSKPAVKAVMNFVTIEFSPDKYAYGRLSLLDEDNTIVSVNDVDFTLEELNSWGMDDNYVLELALQKLGISFG
ncbi:MAG: hypothetical protein ACK55Z_21875 [bacterium]|jgi:hypothetical protein